MLETLIVLKPPNQWRKNPTWYSSWSPLWLKPLLRQITPDHLSADQLVGQLNDAQRAPRPLQRLDHAGQRPHRYADHWHSDAGGLEDFRGRHRGDRADRNPVQCVPGTRSVFAERTGGGYFLDLVWNREAPTRYGLRIEDRRFESHPHRASFQASYNASQNITERRVMRIPCELRAFGAGELAYPSEGAARDGTCDVKGDGRRLQESESVKFK
jgi:hypothetical protein